MSRKGKVMPVFRGKAFVSAKRLEMRYVAENAKYAAKN